MRYARASTRAMVSSAEFLNCAPTRLPNLIERSAGKKSQRPPISDDSRESLSNAEALSGWNLQRSPRRQILLKRLDKDATNFPETDHLGSNLRNPLPGEVSPSAGLDG